MVDIGPEARNVRLAALIERAEKVFERSRRLVEEARKTRSEAEAKSRLRMAQSGTDNAEGSSTKIGKISDQAAE